jgi:hypothetical protein
LFGRDSLAITGADMLEKNENIVSCIRPHNSICVTIA